VIIAHNQANSPILLAWGASTKHFDLLLPDHLVSANVRSFDDEPLEELNQELDSLVLNDNGKETDASLIPMIQDKAGTNRWKSGKKVQRIIVSNVLSARPVVFELNQIASVRSWLGSIDGVEQFGGTSVPSVFLIVHHRDLITTAPYTEAQLDREGICPETVVICPRRYSKYSKHPVTGKTIINCHLTFSFLCVVIGESRHYWPCAVPILQPTSSQSLTDPFWQPPFKLQISFESEILSREGSWGLTAVGEKEWRSWFERHDRLYSSFQCEECRNLRENELQLKKTKPKYIKNNEANERLRREQETKIAAARNAWFDHMKDPSFRERHQIAEKWWTRPLPIQTGSLIGRYEFNLNDVENLVSGRGGGQRRAPDPDIPDNLLMYPGKSRPTNFQIQSQDIQVGDIVIVIMDRKIYPSYPVGVAKVKEILNRDSDDAETQIIYKVAWYVRKPSRAETQQWYDLLDHNIKAVDQQSSVTNADTSQVECKSNEQSRQSASTRGQRGKRKTNTRPQSGRSKKSRNAPPPPESDESDDEIPIAQLPRLPRVQPIYVNLQDTKGWAYQRSSVAGKLSERYNDSDHHFGEFICWGSPDEVFTAKNHIKACFYSRIERELGNIDAASLTTNRSNLPPA
jgi:hypothetical protein